jgi:DNA polymerase-4
MERPLERRATTRTAVVWETCRRRLEQGGAGQAVLDIGGGTGGFAVRVAGLGHHVTVVDPSPDALAALDRRAREHGVADLVTGLQGDLAGVIDLVPAGGADLVLCHGVLGLVDDPLDALAVIGRLLRAGGALSLLVSQRHAAVVGRAMAGHFAQARDLLEGVAQPGDQEHRFTADEVRSLLDDGGFTLEEMHAVRVFTDLVPSALLDLEPGAVDGLLDLERAVADRPEYLSLAAQLHAVAVRGPLVSAPDERSSACRILHVDMDAFYASVAIRDRPELQRVPVVVGGGHRGVVLSANYPARAFGVRSGMSGRRAHELCPQAVRLAPDFRDVETVSRSVMEIFRAVTPLVEAYSLDEAFLDVSGAVRRLGPPHRIGEHIRARVHDEQRIDCSVGVAASVSVAKLASRRAKPDGVLVVPPECVVDYLHPLDVGELFGIGPRTRERLHRLGLVSVGDVAHTPRPTLQLLVGRALGAQLHRLAWGNDRTTVTPRRSAHDPERSMGAEETFGHDVADRAVISRELLRLSGKVTARMRRVRVAGRTVALRVRYSDFTTLTRSRTLPDPTDVGTEVHAEALRLYDALPGHRLRIRLVGVRVEGLVPLERAHRQLRIDEREHGWPDADRAVDRIHQRFGRGTVRPAALLGGDRP